MSCHTASNSHVVWHKQLLESRASFATVPSFCIVRSCGTRLSNARVQAGIKHCEAHCKLQLLRGRPAARDVSCTELTNRQCSHCSKRLSLKRIRMGHATCKHHEPKRLRLRTTRRCKAEMPPAGRVLSHMLIQTPWFGCRHHILPIIVHLVPKDGTIPPILERSAEGSSSFKRMQFFSSHEMSDKQVCRNTRKSATLLRNVLPPKAFR